RLDQANLPIDDEVETFTRFTRDEDLLSSLDVAQPYSPCERCQHLLGEHGEVGQLRQLMLKRHAASLHVTGLAQCSILERLKSLSDLQHRCIVLAARLLT